MCRTSSGAIIVSDPTQGLNATRIAVRGARGLRVALSEPAIGRGGTLTPVRGFAAPELNNLGQQVEPVGPRVHPAGLALRAQDVAVERDPASRR
jgi:hypothetical protein